MESLGVALFDGAYRRRRVLITGHTGFKGSWLALWLTRMGAQVAGFALPERVSSPNHWELLDLPITDMRGDIRDPKVIAAAIRRFKPELVFHLAAQSLVRRSYANPSATWSTNVDGTISLLEACQSARGLRAVVVVTSDKCYENRSLARGYRESDALGGHDPYSASKAATELVVQSYRNASFANPKSPLLATVRAGNVIGGGDWSEDRLIPDLARASARRRPLEIRFPSATRPWQHVLEPLSGYLSLGQRLLRRDRHFEGAWNFGPSSNGVCSVRELLTKMALHWPDVTWKAQPGKHPQEALQLALNSTKARSMLQWRPVWGLDRAIAATADWYRHFLALRAPISEEQLRRYCRDAERKELEWTAA